MKWQIAARFLALAFLVSSCAQAIAPTPAFDTFGEAVTLPSPIPPTATAFQPLAPTPTPEPRSRTYVILGEDLDRIGWGVRTDVIMLVTVNLVEKELNLISIPRDLVVEVPCLEPRTFDGVAWGRWDRVNGAWYHGEQNWGGRYLGDGGFACVRETVEWNFGLHVDGVVMVDFEGFMNLIDLVGPIRVTASDDYTDWCGNHRDYSAHGAWHVWNRGDTYEMDGNRALCYARAREFSGDLDRNRRQQDIMAALREQVVPLMADGFVTDPIHFPPDVLRIVSENASTDMGSGELLLGLADVLSTKDWPIHTMRLLIGQDVTYGRLGPASVVYLTVPGTGTALDPRLYPVDYLDHSRLIVGCFIWPC